MAHAVSVGRAQADRDKMTWMTRQPLPAIAAAVSFIDCINRGDLDGLAVWLDRRAPT
jgi:hypothetical protein